MGLRIIVYLGLLAVALGGAWQYSRSTEVSGIDVRLAWHEMPDSAPRVGERAPDFTLMTIDLSAEVTLSTMTQKPVVLVFGSYT